MAVDNRGGANGLIGAEAVAKSPADGYTIMFHSVTTHLINASFYSKIAYDTLGDFAPVSLIGEAAHVLVANPAFAPRSIKELVALASASPDPGFSQKLEERGLDSVTPGTVGEMAGYVKAQLPKWGMMVKESGARGD